MHSDRIDLFQRNTTKIWVKLMTKVNKFENFALLKVFKNDVQRTSHFRATIILSIRKEGK